VSSALKICPICSTEYPANERFCPRDGSALRAQGGSSMDLVGSIIAQYHVIKKLGEGGMGQVYLAEHVKMGRKSAVKVMNPGMVDNVDAISRFNREAANASKINHPNVAGIYDFGETPDGLIFLAMEFVEGEPLTDIIKTNGHLPPMRATEIARQAAEGLSVAHDMGIVHRDLKPDNIMIAKGRGGADMVKVVDFGIAKAAASDNQKVTKTGMVVGTPEYMSPEQLSGDPLDARSDIYSLGLVTFAMLTGKLPFPSESAQETMIMRLTDKPKGLGEMKPDMHWPDDVQAVMDKVLQRDVNLRYRSASEYAHDLVEAVDRMPAISITTVKTHLVSAMTPAEAAAAATAATVVGMVPPTRVGTKGEMAGRTVGGGVAGNQASPAAVSQGGGGKSKVAIYSGVGVLIAAGVIYVMVTKGTGSSAGKGPSSSRPNAAAPANTTTKTDSIRPTGSGERNAAQGTLPNKSTGAATQQGAVGQQLYDINSNLQNLEDSKDTARFREQLRKLDGLNPRTASEKGYADIIRATALLGLGTRDDSVKACAKLQGASINAALDTNKRQLAKDQHGVSCPQSE
jgi:eukaryotic-like serine/threonine-protein kinase